MPLQQLGTHPDRHALTLILQPLLDGEISEVWEEALQLPDKHLRGHILASLGLCLLSLCLLAAQLTHHLNNQAPALYLPAAPTLNKSPSVSAACSATQMVTCTSQP